MPADFKTLPEAKSKCSENVQESVESTQFIVLSVAPFKVIPPPSAVVSEGVETLPISMLMSSTVSVVVSIVVVVPFTVKLPPTVRLPGNNLFISGIGI